MDKAELIERSYQEFRDFQKPDKLTKHDDSLEEQDHEKSLKNVERHDLTIELIGPITWSPISYLNCNAIAYYMPRLIEFALLNVNDVDEEPFINRFVNYFFTGPEDERFKLFRGSHRELMKEVFIYLKHEYSEMLELEGWSQEVDLAIKNWSRSSL